MIRLSLFFVAPLAFCAVNALTGRLGTLVATSQLAAGYYPYFRRQTSSQASASCQTLELPAIVRVAVTSRVAAMHEIVDLERRLVGCIVHPTANLLNCLLSSESKIVSILNGLIRTHKDLLSAPSVVERVSKKALMDAMVKKSVFKLSERYRLQLQVEGNWEALLATTANAFIDVSKFFNHLVTLEVQSVKPTRAGLLDSLKQARLAYPPLLSLRADLRVAGDLQVFKLAHRRKSTERGGCTLRRRLSCIATKQQFRFFVTLADARLDACKGLEAEEGLVTQYNELVSEETTIAEDVMDMIVRGSKKDLIRFKQNCRDLRENNRGKSLIDTLH